MKSTLIFLLCTLYINCVHAVMPTIDVFQQEQDLTAMSVYTTKITTSLLKIGQAVDIAVKLRELKSLQDVANVGGAICQLCSTSEQQELQLYINQVNDDLCSQFSTAMNSMIGVQQTIKDLKDIIQNFNTNPKEAGLALQAASIQTQAAVQGTLAQIQVLLAQTAQKRLAEEKLAKQDNAALYAGFKQSGL